MRRTAAFVAFAALAAVAVPGCAAEKICEPGKVVVEHDAGGRYCAEPESGDEDCPAGEILLKNPDAGREGCIVNRYSSRRYTDQLSSE